MVPEVLGNPVCCLLEPFVACKFCSILSTPCLAWGLPSSGNHTVSPVTRQSSPKLEHFQRLECRRSSISTPELGLQDRALMFSLCSRPPWGIWLCLEVPSRTCFPPPPPHFRRAREAQNHLASHFSWRTYGLGLHVFLAFSGPDPTPSMSLISLPGSRDSCAL